MKSLIHFLLLVMSKTSSALERYLSGLTQQGLSLPLHVTAIRTSVFKVDSWKMENPKLEEFLFAEIEQYLADNVASTTSAEWNKWLEASRLSCREIDVLVPYISQAILQAKQLDKLDDIDEENNHYLLRCYREKYGSLLDKADISEKSDLVGILLEYASLTHLVGSDEDAIRILRKWDHRQGVRPRSLLAMTDEVAASAPIRGVGSPHGMSITLYHGPPMSKIVRIVCAGATGDATLNTQVFTTLFAAGLACDKEPTLITLNGAALSLDTTSRSKERSATDFTPLLSAVLGPSGPTQPRPGMPSLGMPAEKALELTHELFDRFKTKTGLVSVMRWKIQDAERIDRQAKQALENATKRTLIRSEERNSEGASVVHLMPLLHRDKSGRATQIEIRLPCKVLGTQKVFELLREVRNDYMMQLIAAGRRRQLFAQTAYLEHKQLIEQWRAMPEKQKKLICQEHPTVIVTQSYDFQRGIIVPLPKPMSISRAVYESQHRPQICEGARLAIGKFEKLCKMLAELNKSGGKADVLTFKLLVDAMLRRAPLLIDNVEFQDAYKEWTNVTSAPVWVKIQEWALRRGLDPSVLAADNVIFNAQLETDGKYLIIQPWVLVDMHDFVLHIDGEHGLMWVTPSGKTSTLTSTLGVHDNQGLAALKNLHLDFCNWVEDNLALSKDVNVHEQQSRQTLLDDSRIMARLYINQAKMHIDRAIQRLARRPLSAQNVEEAIAQAIAYIEGARSLDFGPVYFWGAIVCQFKAVMDEIDKYVQRNIRPGELKTSIDIVDITIKILTEALRREVAGSTTAYIETRLIVSEPKTIADRELDKFLNKYVRTVKIVPDAQQYLAQLQACDSDFVSGLLQKKPLNELESLSLGLTDIVDQKRVHATRSIFSALEQFHLAENIRDTALELSLDGARSKDISNELIQLLLAAENLEWGRSHLAKQLNDLVKEYSEITMAVPLLDFGIRE